MDTALIAALSVVPKVSCSGPPSPYPVPERFFSGMTERDGEIRIRGYGISPQKYVSLLF